MTRFWYYDPGEQYRYWKLASKFVAQLILRPAADLQIDVVWLRCLPSLCVVAVGVVVVLVVLVAFVVCFLHVVLVGVVMTNKMLTCKTLARRQTNKTNGKKCQKATTRFLIMAHTLFLHAVSLPLALPLSLSLSLSFSPSRFVRLSFLGSAGVSCRCPKDQWSIRGRVGSDCCAFSPHDSLHCELRSAVQLSVRVCVFECVCGVPILWFAGRVPLISSVVSATAYNGYWQPTTSQQQRGREREGRSGRVVQTKGHPGKKFHLPVQYKVPIHGCQTLSLHLCLSIKLIITILIFLRLN